MASTFWSETSDLGQSVGEESHSPRLLILVTGANDAVASEKSDLREEAETHSNQLLFDDQVFLPDRRHSHGGMNPSKEQNTAVKAVLSDQFLALSNKKEFRSRHSLERKEFSVPRRSSLESAYFSVTESNCQKSPDYLPAHLATRKTAVVAKPTEVAADFRRNSLLIGRRLLEKGKELNTSQLRTYFEGQGVAYNPYAVEKQERQDLIFKDRNLAELRAANVTESELCEPCYDRRYQTSSKNSMQRTTAHQHVVNKEFQKMTEDINQCEMVPRPIPVRFKPIKVESCDPDEGLPITLRNSPPRNSPSSSYSNHRRTEVLQFLNNSQPYNTLTVPGNDNRRNSTDGTSRNGTNDVDQAHIEEISRRNTMDGSIRKVKRVDESAANLQVRNRAMIRRLSGQSASQLSLAASEDENLSRSSDGRSSTEREVRIGEVILRNLSANREINRISQDSFTPTVRSPCINEEYFFAYTIPEQKSIPIDPPEEKQMISLVNGKRVSVPGNLTESLINDSDTPTNCIPSDVISPYAYQPSELIPQVYNPWKQCIQELKKKQQEPADIKEKPMDFKMRGISPRLKRLMSKFSEDDH